MALNEVNTQQVLMVLVSLKSPGLQLFNGAKNIKTRCALIPFKVIL